MQVIVSKKNNQSTVGRGEERAYPCSLSLYRGTNTLSSVLFFGIRAPSSLRKRRSVRFCRGYLRSLRKWYLGCPLLNVPYKVLQIEEEVFFLYPVICYWQVFISLCICICGYCKSHLYIPSGSGSNLLVAGSLYNSYPHQMVEVNRYQIINVLEQDHDVGSRRWYSDGLFLDPWRLWPPKLVRW